MTALFQLTNREMDLPWAELIAFLRLRGMMQFHHQMQGWQQDAGLMAVKDPNPLVRARSLMP